MIKLIKTTIDHEQALKRIEFLLTHDISTEEADELELLAYLVDRYEEQEVNIDFPTPIDAIIFKMDQLNLKQADLIPFIGSKSRVSEILNRKRPLTLKMARALHKGLFIPAEILLQEPKGQFPTGYDGLEWDKFPLKEIAKRSIIPASFNIKNQAEEALRWLIQAAGAPQPITSCHRQGTWSGKNGDIYATLAWELIVRTRAIQAKKQSSYSYKSFSEKNLCRLAHLSIYADGPLKAAEYLERHGILLIYEPALKKTYLDGAALLLDDGTPVIGLTLRYDRIDYFWFTLFHELAHLIKHLDKDKTPCIIDHEASNNPNAQEEEANNIASNALIPVSTWIDSDAKRKASKKAIINLARELDIHEAIVAGRVRKERNNYRIHHSLLGSNTVRILFE